MPASHEASSVNEVGARRSRSVSGEQQKDKDATSRSQDAAAQSPPRDEAPAADDPAKLARSVALNSVW